MTKKDLKRVLEIESVLTELMLRDFTDPNVEGWSSRVQAERIYAIAQGKSRETIKKPWEHFAIRSLEVKRKNGNCVICGDLTEWGCLDCRIDTQKTVWVCNKTTCRDEHERACSHVSV
jgi:hypothetical protein